EARDAKQIVEPSVQETLVMEEGVEQRVNEAFDLGSAIIYGDKITTLNIMEPYSIRNTEDMSGGACEEAGEADIE
ncbi:hypothetical protein ACLOJK_029243, partial [Asimina triloba]